MNSPSSERHDSRRQHHGSWFSRAARAPDIIAALLAFVVAGTLWWVARPIRSAAAIQEAVVEKSNAVKRAARRGDYDTTTPVARAEKVVADLRSLSVVPNVGRPLPAALTYPGAWLATTRPGESNLVRFGAPLRLAAAVEPGAIVLTWAPPDSTVAVAKFEILRVPGMKGSENLTAADPIGATAADVLTFRDEQVVQGVTYTYTVHATTLDPILVGSGRSRSPNSDPVTQRAVADSKIELVDVADGAVQLRIKKQAGSEWRIRLVTLKEGEVIGGVDPSTGLDWTTNRVVGKISEALSESERPRDEVVFDRQGRVVVDAGIPRRVSTIRRDVWRTISVVLSGGGAPDETLTMEKR